MPLPRPGILAHPMQMDPGYRARDGDLLHSELEFLHIFPYLWLLLLSELALLHQKKLGIVKAAQNLGLGA